MLKEILKEFDLNDFQIEQLNKLREICLDYNKNVNLTSIVDEDSFDKKHILDSISLLKFKKNILFNKKILDVGSGGGFPGLVLAIALPNSKITLIDSNNKKTAYLKHISSKLELKNVSVLNMRVEELPKNKKFDIVVSRAVAKVSVLLEITSQTILVNGSLFFYKGINYKEELPKKWDVINRELGIKYDGCEKYYIDDIKRVFLIFTKTKETNNKFPREFKEIKKRPIY